MSCRETHAGSALTTWARRASGKVLSDPAVLSTFHELNRQYDNYGSEARVYSSEEYYASLRGTRAQVRLYGSAGNNVNSLMRRLNAAIDNDPMPEQNVVHAIIHIQEAVRQRTASLESYLQTMSERMGLSYGATKTRFDELEASTVRTRSRRPDTYTDVNRALATDIGLGQDVGLVNAVARLEEEAQAIEMTRFRAAPQLITRESVFMLQSMNIPGTETTVFIVGWGYDEASGRLEVQVRDRNGAEKVYAYRNVPYFLGTTIDSANWQVHIHGVPQHQYESEYAAARAGVAQRCETCGQYATSGHGCPIQRPITPVSPTTTSSRWSRQTVSMQVPEYDSSGRYVLVDDEVGIKLPAIREFRSLVAAGPVRLAADSTFYYISTDTPSGRNNMTGTESLPCYVLGDTLIQRDPETRELSIDTSHLRCTCPEYRADNECIHVNGYVEAIKTRLEVPTSTLAPGVRRGRMTAEERERALVAAQARSEEVARDTDWMLNEEAKAEAARTWRPMSETLYSEDYEAYKEDVDAAVQRSLEKGGGPAIPYMTENALDGYCQRGSGQAFGMEIEFDIKPGVDKSAALNEIARELYEEGITFASAQVRYGTSRTLGFTDKHTNDNGVGTWSFETDSSVDGELVTPGMYDEPETWEKLAKATEIIRKHGGIASKRAGAHVHVGTSNFNGEVEPYTEMIRILNQHEDVVYRLAANPDRGTHRNNNYSRPLPSVPNSGFADVYRLKIANRVRYSAINFSHVTGGENDHPEYRLWDSSLDPGTMQAQVKMSVFIKEAALRHTRSGTLTKRDKEPSGSHVARFKARGTRVALTDAEMEADSRTTRSFLDTICRRREDKAQLASLVPFTKWGKQRGVRQ